MADFTRFPEAFQKAGIKYTEEPGWRNHGHGDIVQFQFIVVHHTAGGNDSGDIRIVRDGRAGLPGPLSQIVLKRNGEPHIVAAGVSWHAGYGPAMWGAPAGSGNYYSIGIEGVSNGYNDWTPAQRAAYPKVVAAILKEAGLPSDRWIFHRDYNKVDGKIDPAGFDWVWFRDEVNKAYNKSNKTAIQECRERCPALGKKTIVEDELPTLDGAGRWAGYENGNIFWHPNFGAHAVIGGFFRKYAELNFEVGFLGYPLESEKPGPDGGSAMGFQNGALYSHPKYGVFYSTGAIRSAWGAYNYEHGRYGYPISDEKKLPDGKGVMQEYQRGFCYFTPDTGAHWIEGRIWDEYSNQGWEQNLGYPTTDELDTVNQSGRFNHFENGSIYYKWGTSHAWTVKGDILKVWSELGYERGRLGFPINNQRDEDGKLRQDFEGGSIIDTDKDITVIMNDQEIPLPKVEEKVEQEEKPVGYQPTKDEEFLLPSHEMSGGISFFANHNDASTKGRSMGISGESADTPNDQWFCAMRFAYVATKEHPSNPAWVKPTDRSDISQEEKFRLKKYLVGRRLKVTNPVTNKSVIVRPADWGPAAPSRVIDVSETTIKSLGAQTDDVVHVEWVDPSTPLGPVV